MENLGGYQPRYVQNSFGRMGETNKQKRSHWPFIVVGLLLLIYFAVVAFWPAPKVSAVPVEISVPAEDVILTLPAYGSSAVGVVGGGVLKSSKNQNPAPIASTAKIMTALAVVKQKPLKPNEQGPVITITQEDVDYYNKQVFEGGSTVPVTLGQQITQRKALEMLLIPSANNIAYALSRWAFGSVENYTKYANNYAKEIGATNSNFTDPSGYEPSTVSTAHDLTLLGQDLINNETLAEIVKMKRVDLGNGISLPSTNSFLTLKSDVIGVKTGHHDQAGGCFVVAVTSVINNQSFTTVGAVTNASNLIQAMNDSYDIARTVNSQISDRLVFKRGQTIGKYSAPWGSQSDAVLSSDLSVLQWRGSEISPRISLSEIQTASKGTKVGKADALSVNGNYQAIDAELKQTISAPSLIWRLTHPLEILLQ